MSSVKTPKRKASAVEEQRSSGLNGKRSSTRSRKTPSQGSKSQRKRANRRGSDKWNVKADDPDVAKYEQATVPTTKPPLSKSALKRKYTKAIVVTIDAGKEAQALLTIPMEQWDKIVTGLEKIRALASSRCELTTQHESAVFEALSRCIGAQRSAIPRHALNTMQCVLSAVNRSRFSEEPYAKSVVALLVKTSGTHDKKFIKAAATRCLTEAINTMQGDQNFADLFTAAEILQNRNRNIVSAGISGFQRCVEACTGSHITQWDPEKIVASMHRVLLAKAAANIRTASKAVVRVLFDGLQTSTVDSIKEHLASKRGVTSRDVEAIFVKRRHSARKKARSGLRPWARGRKRARAGERL